MTDITISQIDKFFMAAVVEGAHLIETPEGGFDLTSNAESGIGRGNFASAMDLVAFLFGSVAYIESPLLFQNNLLSLGSCAPIVFSSPEDDNRVLNANFPWTITQETAQTIKTALHTVWHADVVAFNGDATKLRIALNKEDKIGADLFRIVVSQMLILHYVETERYQFQLADQAEEQKRNGGAPIGVQPEGNWPRDEGANVNHPAMRRFLTDDNHPLNIPPRPGSPEMNRQMSIHRAMQNAGADIDVAIEHLSERVEQLDDSQDLSNDPGIICLAVLRKTRAAERKRVIQRRINLGIAFCMLVTIVALTIFFGRMMVTSGRNTIISECSVPYGEDRLTAERFQSYSYKELFGFQQIDKSSITEVTKLKLTGDDIIILGVDPKDNKPWRMDFAKGEFGNPILKPTDLYWFVGGRGKASPVAYKAFCH